jgi:oligoendopeptidase F
VLEAKLADPVLQHWQPWLRDLRVFRPHQLSNELEQLLHEKEVAGRSAWCRLFDETVSGLRVPLGNEQLTVSEALNKLSDPDRSVREAAGRGIGEVFGRNIKLLSLITNTLIKDKEIVDTWRHYERPASARNLANMVEDAVVDALVSAVRADYGRLAHRYYRMKAKWLGLAKLQHWDRNAPLPDDDEPGNGGDRDTLLPTPMGRCGAAARKSARRICPSHDTLSAPLHSAQLSWADAGCHDACA